MRLPGEGDREGPPVLNTRNFFLLACRDAFRDGELDAQEKALLHKLAQVLKIPPREARSYARLAHQEQEQGKLFADGPLDLKMLFRRACALAQAKGTINEQERALLGSFSDLLGISMMRVDATLKQLAVKIDQSVKQEERELPKLAMDRNLDGSSTDLVKEDFLSNSQLGIRLPTPPPQPPRKPPAAAGPDPSQVRSVPARMDPRGVAVIRGFGGLGIMALAAGGLKHVWFEAETISFGMLALCLAGMVAGLVLAIQGGVRFLRPPAK